MTKRMARVKYKVVVTNEFSVEAPDAETARYIIDRDLCEYGPLGRIREQLNIMKELSATSITHDVRNTIQVVEMPEEAHDGHPGTD